MSSELLRWKKNQPAPLLLLLLLVILLVILLY
jgi:hypothetical protein